MASTKTEEPAKNTLGDNGISFNNLYFNNGAFIEKYIPILRGSVFVYVFNVGIYRGEISNGTAKIKIPGLNAGTYRGIIIYDGGLNFNKPTKLITFKVLKQNAAIKAENKAYLINYGGKYGITLKDANGKTYTAKTNTKGKAVFKIKKINKKGTFKATVTFKGNTYYKKVSKKVKIKIR